MKKLIAFICILFFASSVISQTVNDEYYSPAKKKLFSKDRVITSLSMGTSMSFLNSSQTTGIATFIAPKIGYQLTDKFQLNVGLMHYTLTGNTFMPLNNNEALYNSGNKNVSGNLIFAEGQYQLNKKWMMTGAVMMDANSLNNKQNNYKAISLGLNYKVTEHSYIGISGTLSQGNSENYIFNAKNNSYEYSPHNDLFFPGLMSGLGKCTVSALNELVK